MEDYDWMLDMLLQEDMESEENYGWYEKRRTN